MNMKKRWAVLSATLALTAVLSGCGNQSGQLAYIGADAAKQMALGLVGVSAGEADVTADLESRNGMDYYCVEITVEGKYYRYDVDALTGTVIASQTPESAAPAAPGSADPVQSAAPAPVDPAVVTPAAQASTPPAAGPIGEEQAKLAALQHAGLKESDVTFVRAYLDWDDGRQVYDVEFYQLSGSVAKEYDYELDALTGAIRDVDYDAEYYAPAPVSTPAPASTPASNGSISADKAKKIALGQVPGATNSNIREFKTDYDDGRLEYEGKIIYNNMEYEFEIDGYSGAIRNWDVESVYD